MAGDDGERRPVPLRGGRGRSRHTESSPAILAPEALSNPLLDPERYLDAALQMLERAREEWLEALAEADSVGSLSLPAGLSLEEQTKEVLKLRGEARQTLRATFRQYQELRSTAHKAEQDLRRRKLEEPLAGRWRDEYEKLRADLVGEYGGMGPQYELLCDNAAATAIRLRQMESSGRDFDSGEYADMVKLHVSVINQLQKYTEAMKSESINKQTQEVAEQIMRILESVFGNAYPDDWKRGVMLVRKEIEGAA